MPGAHLHETVGFLSPLSLPGSYRHHSHWPVALYHYPLGSRIRTLACRLRLPRPHRIGSKPPHRIIRHCRRNAVRPGPGSANTALAAELIDQTNVAYFITHQLPLVIPTTLVVMTLFYFNNRYFDKKEAARQSTENSETTEVPQTSAKPDIPLIFAMLPILPLALLIVFSPYVGLFQPPITLNTTTAMLFSLFVSLVFVGCHTRNIRKTFDAFSSFWKGMGNVFGSVVTLIVASEIFSKGLISLGFIDSLVDYSTHIGLSGIAIAAVFA